MDPKLVDTWMTLVDRYGVELGLLVILLFFLWMAARFLANKVAVPIVAAHVSFVQALAVNNTENTAATQKLATEQTLIRKAVDEKLVATLEKNSREITGAITKQTTDLKQVFVCHGKLPEVKSA